MTDLSMPPSGNATQASDSGEVDTTMPAEFVATLPAPLELDPQQDEHDGAFRWPTPPYASYPAPRAQHRPEPCEIEGINGKMMRGHLTLFVPEDGLAHVQVPPSKTTMALRFNQFRSLALTAPLAPARVPPGGPHGPMLEQRSRTPFKVTPVQGEPWSGETIGHVETDYGLFLFLPLDDRDTVRRVFVPRPAFDRFDIGQRVGELLVESNATTQEQVEHAAEVQQRMRDKKIGEILLTQQIVTAAQLLAAIEKQSKMPMVRIGEALLAMDLISREQLDSALEEQKRDRSVPLGELLVRMGLVSRQDLQTALARKMGYPLVDVRTFDIQADALRKLPYVVAQRQSALPLILHDGMLVVAMEDPGRRLVLSELEFVAQCKVVPVLAMHGHIEAILREVYLKIGADVGYDGAFPTDGLNMETSIDDSNKLAETLEKEGGDLLSLGEDDKPIEQSDNSLVRLINSMILEAHNQGVSDIHIESYPGREKIKIRFRKDGLLQPYLELPHNYRSAIIARVKIMCDLDISEKRKPQDGKINFARFVPGQRIELRVATIPTNNGLEDVVMRILASAKPLPLDGIGLSPTNLERLKTGLERPYGLVLCVGPTGSGKTTTLHSALAYINVPERKIWTAEDPVEITQPGLRQVQVNPKIDWTFAKALRAFLRADPDVIMIGEMRDEETANMAVEASLTGHLVLSTLHTNSAPETVTRLLDMGLDPFNFADSLLVVLAQRLVRRLCNQCRVSEPADPDYIEEALGDYLSVAPHDDPAFSRDALLQEWIKRFGRDGKLQKHHSPGCEHCHQTGYKGRAGIHELMAMSPGLRRLVQTGARAEELQMAALREGMRTLRQDGIEKVLQGLTSFEEVRATSNA